jgi:hypothetical protein
MQVAHLYRVHFLDLQEYLAKVYKMRDYDIRRATGGTEGFCPEYIVDGMMPDATNSGQQVENIRRGRKTRQVGLILDVLCQDGFIPAGKYVIDMTPPPNPIVEYTRLLHEHAHPKHPECEAFRRQHRDNADFQRRATTLDKLTRDYQEQLETTNDRP